MASKLDKARTAVKNKINAPGKKVGNNLAKQLLPKTNIGAPRKKK